MQQNPSQGIHEYSLESVYTPGDSNSRRSRASFDFVVTQQQLDQYKAAHAGAIDLGDLILSNMDGSSGPALEQPIDHAIRVCIDAATSEDDAFFIGGGRFVAGGDIFTSAAVSAWLAGYNGETLLHIYSRGPYSITPSDMCGGIAYCSTPEAYLNIAGAAGSSGGWKGVCKVGTCKCDGVFNTYGRSGWDGESGLTLIYEKCLEGAITWESYDADPRLKDSDVPGAVCAPWLSPNVRSEIQLTHNLSRKYGIFNRIEQARGLGASPVIVAIGDGVSYILQLVGIDGTTGSFDAHYVFEGEGRRLVVNYDDSLMWSTPEGAGSGRGVLVDTTVGAPSEKLHMNQGITWSYKSAFTDLEGMPTPQSPLDISDAVELEWYTWDGVVIEGQTYINSNSNLCIDVDSLKESVVYRVKAHIMNLSPLGGGREITVDASESPAKLALPDKVGGESVPEFAVLFYNQAGGRFPIWGWGIDPSKGGASYRYNIRKHWNVASAPSTSSMSESPQEVAWGCAVFMKHSNKIIALLY